MITELAGIRKAQVSPILICTSLVLLQPDNAVPECAALPCSPPVLLPGQLLSFPAALDFPTYDASAEAQEASKKFEPLLKQVRHSLGLVQNRSCVYGVLAGQAACFLTWTGQYQAESLPKSQLLHCSTILLV